MRSIITINIYQTNVQLTKSTIFMKISKSIQSRTIVLTVVIALVALFQAANLGVQLFNSSNLYSENPNHTFLGALDTKYGSMIVADDYQQYSMVVERDS